MEKKDNSQPFYKVLLSAGLLSFILGGVSLWVNTLEKQKLDQRQFQNRLIERAMSMDGQDRYTYIQTLFKSGIIETIYKDSLVRYTGYWRGYQAVRIEIGMMVAIEEFYKQQGRIPFTIEELGIHIPIKKMLSLLDSNIYYYAYDNNNRFELRFPGSDEVLLTPDDAHYRFNKGKTYAWNKDELKWEIWQKPKDESLKQ
jgi:hypothetical protein